MINGVVLGSQDVVSFRDEIVAFVEKSDEQTDAEPDAPADADTQE